MISSWLYSLLKKLGLVSTRQIALRERLAALSQMYPHGPATLRMQRVGSDASGVAAVLADMTGWERTEAHLLLPMTPVTLLVNVAIPSAQEVAARLEAAGATMIVALDAGADLRPSATTKPLKPSPRPSAAMTPTPPAKPRPQPAAGYSLRLLAAGSNAESVIHFLHEQSGLSLTETRALVDSAPCQVLKELDPHTGRALHKKLESLGATCELVGGLSVTASLAVRMPGAYNLVLLHGGNREGEVTAVIRDLLDKPDVADVKRLLSDVPQPLLSGVARATAESVKYRLEAVGAVVKLERMDEDEIETAALTHPDNSAFLFGDYDVNLQVVGAQPERIVAVLRDLLNSRSLAEVEQLVAAPPRTIVQRVPWETAVTIKARLEAAGATVTIASHPDDMFDDIA